MQAFLYSLLNYEIVDKKTGEVKSGTNLYYISDGVYYDGLNYFGYYPAKLQVSPEVVKKFNLEKLDYPCTADLEFSVRPLPNGKSATVLVGVKNVKSINLFNEKTVK